MRQTTREIINRALKLTDFNNDFFMGNRELSQLLNDCWNEAYSILVGIGDRSFLKRTSLRNDERLPKELFKIHEVTDSQNNILMKNQDYDITGNRIHIEQGLDSVQMSYYPSPQTLVLKSNETKKLGFGNVVGKWEDGFITENSLTDENGNTVLTFSGAETILGNGYISSGRIREYNGETFEGLKLIEGNSVTYDTVHITSSVQNLMAVITDRAHSFFYLLSTGGTLYTEDGEEITSGFKPKSFFCRGDGLYFISGKGLKRVLGKEIESFPSGAYSASGILDEDYAVFSIGNDYVQKGYGFDTLLDVPNQLFWSYFAYSIAESICNVVQRDSTAISAKKMELTKQFMDSFTSDNNASYQIRNVEGYRQW